MTVRYRFDTVCTAFGLGCIAGLFFGTHLYTLFTGG